MVEISANNWIAPAELSMMLTFEIGFSVLRDGIMKLESHLPLQSLKGISADISESMDCLRYQRINGLFISESMD